MKIALAGNPNSGKTTLFNAITGKLEYVGNWPGVTVEKKVANLKREYKICFIPRSADNTSECGNCNHEINNGVCGCDEDNDQHDDQHGDSCCAEHNLSHGHSGHEGRNGHHGHGRGHSGKSNEGHLGTDRGKGIGKGLGIGTGSGFNRVQVVDLPGAYSMTPFTGEETVTRDYIIDEKPDVIINIVDSTTIERSLFLTTQLLELGVPVVIALNKQDVLKRRGDLVDIEGLKKELKCEIVEISASNLVGLKDLIATAMEAALSKQQVPLKFVGQAGQGIQIEDDEARKVFTKQLAQKYIVKKRSSSEITLSDRIDRIVSNNFIGLPLFALIMWGVYAFSINGLGGWLNEYIEEDLFGEIVPDLMNNFLESIGVHPLLQALIVDGAIGGVGAVLSFLPLIMVLFFCLALLEDSGYMARVAIVMDRHFKKIGLSGRSIIPMIVGTGCTIPGIMAARTIEDTKERRLTTMLTPFVPCGAKLPVIALFTAVFFPTSTWVFPSVYILAGVVIVLSGLLLKKLYNYNNPASFILELPDYKIPSLKHAVKQMFSQAKEFIYRAATIILVMNTLVWILQSYDWTFQVVEDQSVSMLAGIGGFIAPILIPLGFIGWQMAAVTLTGFIAKENVVATFAVLLAASESSIHVAGGPLTQFFTPVTAFAFLAFNLFIPPCFAAIGAMNAELGGKKFLFQALAFQFSVGYTIAMLITQIGTLLAYGEVAAGFIPAIIVSVVMAGIAYYLIRRANNRAEDEDDCITVNI